MTTEKSYSKQELDKFDQLAAQWWHPKGVLHTLHEINPIRLNWISQQAALKDKQVLDVGCGGGILTESMALAGAKVTGIDLANRLIETAQAHARQSQVDIAYHCISAEELAQQCPNKFDLITCMEMLEHVPDPTSIIKACATMLKPQGKLILSTLNRTPKAYLYAIIGAEYILKLLPKGTHDYRQFIRPSEIAQWSDPYGLNIKAMSGIDYQVLRKRFLLSADISVNYMLALQCGP
ncbi:MAG: bifunctional 2-polyprenyl-6-hydroxyphenol methylase/3-demethylubiquinol 3-O-methyltransferase UbiG [Pseudomonadota bacterium]